MPENTENNAINTNHESKEDVNLEQRLSKIEEDQYLIRECEVYEDEYKECKSFKARFHQYFIFGETLDCNQWKKDFDNCCKWSEDKNVKAAESLINSERNRRLERLKTHYANNIWKKRDSPPEDWAKPLPEWITKRDANTYLAVKAREMREGKDTVDKDSSYCSIM